MTSSKFFSNCLKLEKNVVWQSYNGRVTSDHCRVTFSDFFQNFSELLETSKKRCLTVIQRSRDLRPLSRDLQWFFWKFFRMARNIKKTLFNSHQTGAWPRTAVAWPFCDFFKFFSNCLKRLKSVVWQSYNGRVTSDYCRVTFSDFFQKFSGLLETSKNIVWQSSNGRATSDHCRVSISDFFQNFSELLETSKNVVWPSYNGRVTSDHCRVTFSDFFQNFSELLETSEKHWLTVIQRSRDLRTMSRDLQWFIWKIFRIAWNVKKTLFDSHTTVAWPLTTVAWPSVTFFKIFPNRLKRPKTLFDSHPTVAWPPTTVAWSSVTSSKFFRIAWNVKKNVVWQSYNGCVTSDHCRVTFSDFFQKFSESLETSKKHCLTVIQRSRDLRPLSRDLQWLFFKIFPNCLKRLKNVVWQSSTSRVTSDHCRVTVQRLFSKIIRIAWNVKKTLFDSHTTVAWPPTTVAWPSVTFF